MISAILFINQKGEILISRFYRDDVSRAAADAFRTGVIAAKQLTTPVTILDGSSFLYIRQGDIYVVGVSKANCNPTLVFQFLYSLMDVLKAYIVEKFDEGAIQNNFVLIYELLDETMDFGYPQLTSVNILKQYIKVGDVKEEKRVGGKSAATISAEITGNVDWREPGKYKYRKNEVFIDVLEAVNLLMSNKGSNILRADVSGKIVMKTYLSGMPECKFGMNDKLVMEKEALNNTRRKKRHFSGIAIDDTTFHRCVKLGQFDHDRTISFVPPDGEFELMRYRITQNVNRPFRVFPIVTEHGKNRVEYEIKVKGNFSSKLFASNVLLRIPTPKSTAKCSLNVAIGKAKYNPSKDAILWKIKKFPGDASYILKGEVRLVPSVNAKQWSRPPITMEFQVPMFTSSGLHVRFMKVFERANYETTKWVRYMTRAGQYQIRI